MRHNKKFNHLSRKKGHREALLSNLAIALIQHKRILRLWLRPRLSACSLSL